MNIYLGYVGAAVTFVGFILLGIRTRKASQQLQRDINAMRQRKSAAANAVLASARAVDPVFISPASNSATSDATWRGRTLVTTPVNVSAADHVYNG